MHPARKQEGNQRGDSCGHRGDQQSLPVAVCQRVRMAQAHRQGCHDFRDMPLGGPDLKGQAECAASQEGHESQCTGGAGRRIGGFIPLGLGEAAQPARDQTESDRRGLQRGQKIAGFEAEPAQADRQ